MASMISEHESFQDVNGKPIVNGYIYVGVAGQDPKLNPVVIYSDRGLTVPIVNPQRTDSYGRATNKIWVSERYSLKVEDANGVQKLQDLERGELDSSQATNLINVQGINDVTAEAVPPAANYIDKAVYVLTVVSTNTGAVTLDFGPGPKDVTKNNGDPLVDGDWEAGSIQRVTYNSFSDRFDLLTFSTTEVNEKIAFFEPSIIAFNDAPPIKGLVVTNNLADLEHDIDISAGRYGVDALALGITKRLDQAFAQGDGNGGFIGSLPVSGVIYIFLIKNGSDSSIDVYAETTNGTSPPSGWTIVKNIATRITDASANLQRVVVSGNGERLTVYPYSEALDWNVSTVPSSRTAYPIGGVLRCPPDVDASISHYTSSSTTSLIIATSLLAADVEPAGQLVDLLTSPSSQQVQSTKLLRVNGDRQIGVRRGGSDVNSSYSGRVIYWIEDRS